jgi:hypothetical protein
MAEKACPYIAVFSKRLYNVSYHTQLSWVDEKASDVLNRYAFLDPTHALVPAECMHTGIKKA